MQRNINNEIIAAVVAVGIITVALIAALLLANTFEDESIVDNDVNIAVAEVTQDAELTVSVLSASPTETHSLIPNTNTPTDSPSPTVTNTDLPTATSTGVPTNTSIPPTDTAIPPTVTDVPTNTSIPPTDTAIPAIPTDKPVPSHTRMATETPRLTATLTASATSTLEITEPTATLTTQPFSVLAISQTSEDCMPPDSWVDYTIRPTDTLYGIAVATETSIYELRIANCITDDQVLVLGDTITVPKLPVEDVPVIRPVFESDDLEIIGCDFPELIFTNITAGQVIDEVFTLKGTMQFLDVGYYAIEARPEDSETYVILFAENLNRTDEPLYTINTSLLPRGINWLRLTVIDATGQPISYATCEIPVIIE